ncbi:hypothetical protein Glove_117g493 [Diversispora epigaea]|uniref:Uncharacterized protein n=1 Tax=Diversispora epigaea TaxID=1348612 RepID=A0A397J4I6_9GLOM|nr:hypothetical protein Glove_117g493 [Diversispora epigaea]
MLNDEKNNKQAIPQTKDASTLCQTISLWNHNNNNNNNNKCFTIVSLIVSGINIIHGYNKSDMKKWNEEIRHGICLRLLKLMNTTLYLEKVSLQPSSSEHLMYNFVTAFISTNNNNKGGKSKSRIPDLILILILEQFEQYYYANSQGDDDNDNDNDNDDDITI